MGMLIGRLILGAICAFAVLVAVERLVAWRRTDPAKEDEQWRKDMFGGRMAAAPFVAAVAGVLIVTVVLAHALFGALSNFGGFIFFLIGAAVVAAVRRKRLPPIRQAVLEAVREIKLTDDQQMKPGRGPHGDRRESGPPSASVKPAASGPVTPDRHAAAGGGRSSRRNRRRASVPVVDEQVRQVIERSAGDRSVPAPQWTVPAATRAGAQRRDGPSLVDARRGLIAHLQARSAALAAAQPVAGAPIAAVPETAGPDLASPASVESAAAGAQHDDWRTQAAAQREMWRRAGEAQRQQWREETQALQKRLSRPGEA